MKRVLYLHMPSSRPFHLSTAALEEKRMGNMNQCLAVIRGNCFGAQYSLESNTCLYSERHSRWQPIYVRCYMTCELQQRSDASHPVVTNSMDQRPSWGHNGSSATQKIPCILWNPMVHHHIHKSPTSVRIQNQIDPVHVSPCTSLTTILILPSHLCLGLQSGLLSSSFPTKTICTSPFLHTCYMSRLCQSPWVDQPNGIWWGVQSIKLLVM
jgi:hypothetical protein